MKTTRLFLGAVLGLLLAGSHSARAAGFMYFKDSPIVGESTRGGHGGWIEIDSYQWVAGGPNLAATAPGGRGSGGPGSLQVVLKKGPWTSALRRAFETKQRFATIRVDVPKAGGEEVYYKITLTNATVSHIQKGGDSFPTETIKMTYGAIEWTYVAPSPAALKSRSAP